MREEKRQAIAEKAVAFHARSRKIYGYRKVHRDIMKETKLVCCEKTVRKVMRENGLFSRVKRKFVRTTDSRHSLPVGLSCNLNSMKQVCTMKDSAKFCKIPGKGKYPGSFKWPRLDELYFKLFQQEYERKHDAREDMLACAKCFFELKRLGVI